MAGGQCGETALTLARLCYDTLLRCGETALRDAGRKTVTPAYGAGCARQYLFERRRVRKRGRGGLSRRQRRLFHRAGEQPLYHGEIVGFGVLTQLMLEHARKTS
jgi:glycerol dehydrogenase